MTTVNRTRFATDYSIEWELLGIEEALSKRVIPARTSAGSPVIIMADELDARLDAWIEWRTFPRVVERHVAPRDLIDDLLSTLDQSQRPVTSWQTQEHMSPSDSAQTTAEISLASVQADTHPVIKTVNAILLDAFRLKASDIHFENNEDNLQVKYRLDGVLTAINSFSRSMFASQVISRIKVLANLDISERRIPQDGRFRIRADGKEIDFRVSIMPGLHGEDAVLRILDKQHITGSLNQLRLESLGLDANACNQIRRLTELPYGMFLVTGPTGSGKTTTLYAVLSEQNTGRDKIVSIEDPVEYQLPGILQIPVNEKKGLTFATGLRSILRHDPDKIMVGEIRDAETAEIAIQASLTGHAVFTTLHANTVFDVVNRFRHMEVDLHGFVASLNGVMAQRLVRRICPDCKVEHTPKHPIPDTYRDIAFHHGKGCPTCRHTGYLGRKAINEILVMNDRIREEILREASISRLKQLARESGTQTLYESVWSAVRAGVTTLEEAHRVTFAQE